MTAAKMNRSSWVAAVALVALAAAVSVGVVLYQRHQKYEAALAYCGHAALEAWRVAFREHSEEFDRAADAARLAPRMTLAPLVLRMDEAYAKAKKVPSVPCAQAGIDLMNSGMQKQIEGFRMFARQQHEALIEAQFRIAGEEQEQGADAVKKAAAGAVK